MQTFQQKYAAYESAQQSSTSRMLHLIGVPAMIIGVLMITNWFSIDFATKIQISFAWILIIAASVFYIMLNRKMGGIAAIFYIILGLIVTVIAGSTPSFTKLVFALLLLVGGFAAQYFGQRLEKPTAGAAKESPIFMVLIPLFFVYELINMSGFSSLLKK